MANRGIQNLIRRVQALEFERFWEARWSPKALFRHWLKWGITQRLLLETWGRYDRSIVRAFLTTGAFAKWIYELLTTWPDDDPRFLTILESRGDLVDILQAYTTKSECLEVKRLGYGLEKRERFLEARAKVGKLPVYVFPDFPLPDPSAVLAEAIQNWKDCQGPGYTPEPTLEDVIGYMQDKFSKEWVGSVQAGPGD